MSAPHLSGHWQPHILLRDLFYGPGCVETNLLSTLPAPESKAFIITGATLAKTKLISQLESQLSKHHAGTISYVRQHGPVADVDKATGVVLADPAVDTIISVGGGSAIDTAKVISLRAFERRGTPLKHLSIPTTLSGAECTAGGGYTSSDGVKTGFRNPVMSIAAIFYDPRFAASTPRELWLSTGMRAMDHAVECMYHPCAAEMPWKALALWAAAELYHGLQITRDNSSDESVSTSLMLAVYASSGLKGERLQGGMGLSHSLGHALGSPYGIPHGITSCLTLAKVVRLKAQQSSDNAIQISRLLEPFGGRSTGDAVRDAEQVADRIEALVASLDLHVGSLSTWGVVKDELPVIVSRALGGSKGGPQYIQVQTLVAGLFV